MTTHRTRAQERIDQLDTSPAKLTEEIEQLKGELAAARQAANDNLATLQRTAADFANYRRRTAEEKDRDAGLASEYLLLKVLAIADDFDRAIDAMPPELRDDSWIGGIVAIDRKLRALLESEGVRPLEAVGRLFDPREHEAVASVPGTGRPDGEVVGEIQRGYRLRDRVLRPALVAVSSSTSPSSGGQQVNGGETADPSTNPERND